jgi:hypothetical protein
LIDRKTAVPDLAIRTSQGDLLIALFFDYGMRKVIEQHIAAIKVLH